MTTNPDEISLMVPLSDQEAWDLAQFLKRVGFADFRINAVDDEEAYRMQAAAKKVMENLAAMGFSLR